MPLSPARYTGVSSRQITVSNPTCTIPVSNSSRTCRSSCTAFPICLRFMPTEPAAAMSGNIRSASGACCLRRCSHDVNEYSIRYLLLATPIFGGRILVFNIEYRDAQEIYSVITVATSVGIFTECRPDIHRQNIQGLLGGICFGCTSYTIEFLKSRKSWACSTLASAYTSSSR